MRAALLVLPPLLLLLPSLRSTVCQYVAGLNVTEQEHSLTNLKTLDTPAAEIFSSGIDIEAEEEEGKELIAPQFLVGDSSRAESQVKAAKSESGKRNPSKPKRKGSKGKRNKKKVPTPCEEKFKKYCVHGDCIYIEHLEAPSCKCHTNYFGERCVEQFLKTQKSNEAASSWFMTRLPVILAVVLSAHCFAAVIVIVIVLVRKKYAKYDEKEERKKLRQENGSSSNDV